MVELAPAVADTLVWSDRITAYDQQHFVTYARLLDAEDADADWREAARIILRLDPEQDPEHARQCWQRHLERAQWIATTGYQQLIDAAKLRS